MDQRLHHQESLQGVINALLRNDLFAAHPVVRRVVELEGLSFCYASGRFSGVTHYERRSLDKRERATIWKGDTGQCSSEQIAASNEGCLYQFASFTPGILSSRVNPAVCDNRSIATPLRANRCYYEIIRGAASSARR
jgi:hypothetical protein